MQHVYEFTATLFNGQQITMNYKGVSNRPSKVEKKIKGDLYSAFGIMPTAVVSIKLRKL